MPVDRDAEDAFERLVEMQREVLPTVKAEIEKGGKDSCWAWYMFPTEKAGMLDEEETRITADNAKDLFKQDTAAGWQEALEMICDLLEKAGEVPPSGAILPSVDHGRVHFFIKFWHSYPGSTPWMTKVCRRLAKFDFPPR
eukprot:TRINITY_DN4765_c0_g1_i10.p1 TRINITY_DN4765_c0_g1~~TRINITY_DN4765_c0_g1_i10.p1  ORF type:complete len:162 (-),score=31.43 TRINITY_DN4765_c0_g1_i10:323-742(-)